MIYAVLDPVLVSELLTSMALKPGDKITFTGDPKVYVIAGATSNGYHLRPFEQITHMYFDEMVDRPPPSPKRQALLAQLQRAKLSRNKNLVRDLTRQLEKVW